MKLKLTALISLGVSVLFGLCFWNNKRLYKDKTWKWRLLKTTIETSIVSLLAWKMPRVLVAWATIWFVKPCKNPMVRVILAILAGGFFELCIEWQLFELVVLVNVWAVDLLTGTNGYLKRHKEVEEVYGSHAASKAS